MHIVKERSSMKRSRFTESCNWFGHGIWPWIKTMVSAFVREGKPNKSAGEKRKIHRAVSTCNNSVFTKWSHLEEPHLGRSCDLRFFQHSLSARAPPRCYEHHVAAVTGHLSGQDSWAQGFLSAMYFLANRTFERIRLLSGRDIWAGKTFQWTGLLSG